MLYGVAFYCIETYFERRTLKESTFKFGEVYMVKKVIALCLLSLAGTVASGVTRDSSLSVLVIGDSNTEHGFITLALGDTLRKHYGGSTGTGYLPFDSAFYTLRYNRVPGFSIAYPETWTLLDMFEWNRLEEKPYLSPNGQWCKSTSVGARATVTFPGNGIDVYWLAQPAGGEFSVTIGGTVRCTVSTVGEIGVQKTTITGLEGTSQTMQCDVTSLPESGSVILLGVDARTDLVGSGGRSVVHNWGNGWSSTMDFLAIDSLVFQTGLQKLAPDVVVVLLGTNDHLQDSRAPESLTTNLITIINRIKAAGFTGKIMLVSTFMTENESGATFVPQYREISWPGAAAATGVAYWDMSTWFDMWSMPVMMDGNHCNELGGKLIGHEMFRRIQTAFPSSAVELQHQRKLNHHNDNYGQPRYVAGQLILPLYKGELETMELFAMNGTRVNISVQGAHGSSGSSCMVPRLSTGVYSLKVQWQNGRTQSWRLPVLQ